MIRTLSVEDLGAQLNASLMIFCAISGWKLLTDGYITGEFIVAAITFGIDRHKNENSML